jgi:hypothetical protein
MVEQGPNCPALHGKFAEMRNRQAMQVALDRLKDDRKSLAQSFAENSFNPAL